MAEKGYRSQALSLPWPMSTTTNAVYGSFDPNWHSTYLTKTPRERRNRLLDKIHREVPVTSYEYGNYFEEDLDDSDSGVSGEGKDRKHDHRYEKHYRNRNPYDERYRWHLPPIGARARQLERRYTDTDLETGRIGFNNVEDSLKSKLPELKHIELHFRDGSKACVNVKDIDYYMAPRK
ncbi:uncharacterized protein LOC141906985 [Tubulanus polymorphus]|uniref:uncharacterized protein LOC141906985 n=1 Tax=Tubulanus polymorphus TaxID=672921 RepID=UPI003DA45220